METENHGRKVVRRYRETAIWGGMIMGLLVGAVVGGPNLASWSEPVKTYGMYLLIGGAIGALVGYLFYEIFLSGLANAGPSSGISSSNGATGGGSDDAIGGGHD